MIFPTAPFWSKKDPEDALGRIERAINDRNYRLSAGISVSNKFDIVRGALVVSQGNGKYLRVCHVVDASEPIAKSIREGCLNVFDGQLSDHGQIQQLITDLADPQAAVVEKLKCQAGKYVDRVLSVAVCDPGVWGQDFDGRVSYAPFCDATRLAELSGVTVIDSFPSQDLAVGGRGRRLESLPYWIMFADRDPRVARQSRLLISIEGSCNVYVLPASDGLDSDVPRVVSFESVGLEFLNELIGRLMPATQSKSDLDRVYVEGQQVPALMKLWSEVIGRNPNSPGQGIAESQQNEHPSENSRLSRQLADVAEEYFNAHEDVFSDIIRSGICWIADLCLERMLSEHFPAASLLPMDREGMETIGRNSATQLMVSCPEHFENGFLEQFAQRIPQTKVTAARPVGSARCEIAPVVAALLGLFHVDQMPANVPWLTGANCQRILGRITPGRPSNWRQLVRVMADFHPAPMKLKDAV